MRKIVCVSINGEMPLTGAIIYLIQFSVCRLYRPLVFINLIKSMCFSSSIIQMRQHIVHIRFWIRNLPRLAGNSTCLLQKIMILLKTIRATAIAGKHISKICVREKACDQSEKGQTAKDCSQIVNLWKEAEMSEGTQHNMWGNLKLYCQPNQTDFKMRK